jgi:type VI secretion system secreted protein VgrG
MQRDGTITIKGKGITIKGASDINVNATGDVNIKGKNVKHNC